MTYGKAFLAGFLATLLCHQPLLGVLHLLGPAPAPYNLSPVAPFGLPAVVSLAFWGGVWGLPIWWLIKQRVGASYWLTALAAGALGPSTLALLVVFPLKGMPVAGGWDPALIIAALMLNGAWGLGHALVMHLLKARAEIPQVQR